MQPVFELIARVRRLRRKVFGMSHESNCLFCRIVRKEIPAKTLHEDEHCVAFSDINPQAPTHFLVIPKKHIPTLMDLSPGDSAVIGHMLQVVQALAKKQGIAENGFRVVNNIRENGGQTVYHLHLHVLGGRALGWPPG